MDSSQSPKQPFTFTTNYEVYPNQIEYIAIAEDTLWKFAKVHLENNRKDWIPWLALTVSLLVVNITANFKSWIVSPEVWQAIFVILLGLALIMFVKELYCWILNRSSIDEFVTKCKAARK